MECSTLEGSREPVERPADGGARHEAVVGREPIAPDLRLPWSTQNPGCPAVLPYNAKLVTDATSAARSVPQAAAGDKRRRPDGGEYGAEILGFPSELASGSGKT